MFRTCRLLLSGVRHSVAALRLQHRNVRTYEQLRTAHLERARDYEPAAILYRSTRYDFDPALTSGLELMSVRPLRLAATLLTNRVDRLEINEPLARGGLTTGCCAVAAVRIGGWFRPRTTVVCYAIENLNPFAAAPRRRVKSRIRRWAELGMSRWLASQLDRIAYGTSSAQDLYRTVFPAELRGTASRLVPALPAACDCVAGEGGQTVRGGVTFLGSFDARKGITQLMSAWHLVLASVVEAELRIIGKGPLLSEVERFVAEHPSATLIVDPARTAIHEVLRASAVLVLLSQKSATWREQVGLPIVEGLSHGCTVVTTTETGLADWLAAHGHLTIDPDSTTAETAAAIVAALGSARSALSVTDDLPQVDGREEADRWLMRAPDRDPERQGRGD